MPRSGDRGGTDTRARIAAIAARLFVDRGFDDVTVAEIARDAGVSSVTVFKHFPRKEDLFLDRAADAADLLRSTVRGRGDVDVLAALHTTARSLLEERHPLSGLNEDSVSFFRTVAASPTLITRARELAADLERVLAEELEADPAFTGDPALVAALFMAGYRTAFVRTARRRIDGTPVDEALSDHRARLDGVVEALRIGVLEPGGITGGDRSRDTRRPAL